MSWYYLLPRTPKLKLLSVKWLKFACWYLSYYSMGLGPVYMNHRYTSCCYPQSALFWVNSLGGRSKVKKWPTSIYICELSCCMWLCLPVTRRWCANHAYYTGAKNTGMHLRNCQDWPNIVWTLKKYDQSCWTSLMLIKKEYSCEKDQLA